MDEVVEYLLISSPCRRKWISSSFPLRHRGCPQTLEDCIAQGNRKCAHLSPPASFKETGEGRVSDSRRRWRSRKGAGSVSSARLHGHPESQAPAHHLDPGPCRERPRRLRQPEQQPCRATRRWRTVRYLFRRKRSAAGMPSPWTARLPRVPYPRRRNKDGPVARRGSGRASCAITEINGSSPSSS